MSKTKLTTEESLRLLGLDADALPENEIKFQEAIAKAYNKKTTETGDKKLSDKGIEVLDDALDFLKSKTLQAIKKEISVTKWDLEETQEKVLQVYRTKNSTFYEMLGISESATAEQMKLAYQKLTKEKQKEIKSTMISKRDGVSALDYIKILARNPEAKEQYDKALIELRFGKFTQRIPELNQVQEDERKRYTESLTAKATPQLLKPRAQSADQSVLRGDNLKQAIATPQLLKPRAQSADQSVLRGDDLKQAILNNRTKWQQFTATFRRDGHNELTSNEKEAHTQLIEQKILSLDGDHNEAIKTTLKDVRAKKVRSASI